MTMVPWFDDLLREDQHPKLDGGLWRLHPQPDDQFFADYLPRHYLESLTRAPELGWRRAVEVGLPTLSKRLADYTRDYFLEPYRAKFVDDLGIGASSVVVDFGCGWGFASQRALELGARVVGTDNALGRLKFCHTRFTQQSMVDRFVGIELDANAAFPFRPGIANAVIVSGLLEWVACSKEGVPLEVQRAFLDKTFSLLAPEGRLYLAIENRYWFPYFLGALDLHTRQPLVSILPRRLARALSMLMSGKDYRAHTYSMAEYLRLLKETGYRRVKVSYPQPDYVQPRKVEVLLDDVDLTRPLAEVMAAARGARNKWASRFGMSFTFIATK